MSILLAWLAVFLLLAVLAAAGQSAFGYLNATRMRRLLQQGATRSQAMFEVVQHPAPVLTSIALLQSLSIAGATATTILFIQRYVSDTPVRVITVVVVVTLVLAAQSLGRRLATIRPERAATILYGPLRTIGLVTMPLYWPWYLLADRALRTIVKGEPEDRVAATEEDLRILVDAVEETEALEEEEREMITSIFELSDRDVREIMVPRPDVVAAEASMSVAQAVDLLVSTGHSRVPVYEGDVDHILGIVHLRDLTEALRDGRGDDAVASAARPVHVVPETKKIDEMLHDFQTQHLQLAVVVDEYGGTAGLVTIEDLLEEIVGEIHDEYDVVQERIQRISDNEAILDAGISIHDANEALNLNLDAAEYETIGGLIYDRMGKVPSVGDVVEADHCTFRVLATKGRRVQRVHVAVMEH